MSTSRRCARSSPLRLGWNPGTASIEFLSGGVSSAVVRVVAGGDCFVVKQALPRLRVEAIWLSRPERSGIEARCAGVLDRTVPGSVPRVLRVVPEAHAFVMECAPEGSETWKSILMRGVVDLAMARKAGVLLGRIHATTAMEPALAAEFADTSFFTELRVEPYLHEAAARHPGLAAENPRAEHQALRARSVSRPWRLQPEEHARDAGRPSAAPDHEVAHWGQPAFDVAFALSHLCLKAVRFRGRAPYLEAANTFLAAYRGTSSVADVATGTLCGGLLAGLMLARVDGKSPVEYLADDDKSTVRMLAGRILRDPGAFPDTVLDEVRRVMPMPDLRIVSLSGREIRGFPRSTDRRSRRRSGGWDGWPCVRAIRGIDWAA